jgi:deoxyribonuclease-4
MKFGVHIGVGDGYEKAVSYAQTLGCSAVQLFSGNPRSYSLATIDPVKLGAFADAREAAGIGSTAIHTSYLINLASEEAKTVGNSKRLIKHDLKVAAAGRMSFVNTHLGSYGTRDRKDGFGAVVKALGECLADIEPNVYLILENSAGAGNLCGGTVEELGELVRALDHPQLGICIDTAHAWAAGYELDGDSGVNAFFELLDREVSLDRVKMFHLNDTKVPLGGKKDRHWHIGEGLIGNAGFTAFLSHAGVRGKTAILETPGEEADDQRNMATIRTLLSEVS